MVRSGKIGDLFKFGKIRPAVRAGTKFRWPISFSSSCLTSLVTSESSRSGPARSFRGPFPSRLLLWHLSLRPNHPMPQIQNPHFEQGPVCSSLGRLAVTTDPEHLLGRSFPFFIFVHSTEQPLRPPFSWTLKRARRIKNGALARQEILSITVFYIPVCTAQSCLLQLLQQVLDFSRTLSFLFVLL